LLDDLLLGGCVRHWCWGLRGNLLNPLDVVHAVARHLPNDVLIHECRFLACDFHSLDLRDFDNLLVCEHLWHLDHRFNNLRLNARNCLLPNLANWYMDLSDGLHSLDLRDLYWSLLLDNRRDFNLNLLGLNLHSRDLLLRLLVLYPWRLGRQLHSNHLGYLNCLLLHERNGNVDLPFNILHDDLGYLLVDKLGYGLRHLPDNLDHHNLRDLHDFLLVDDLRNLNNSLNIFDDWL